MHQPKRIQPGLRPGGYLSGTPIEVKSKKVSRTEITSNVSPNTMGAACGETYSSLGFCTEVSLCVTVDVDYTICKVKYEQSSGREYAICPSGRRIQR